MLLGLALFIGLVIVVVYLVKLYMSSNNGYWPKLGVRLIKFGDVGSLYEVFTRKKSFTDIDVGYYKAVGNERFAGTMEMLKPVLCIKDMDLIKFIMVKDFDHFVDRRTISFDGEPVFQKMLVSLHGQEWKDLRSILSPTFTTGKIRRMFQHFNNTGKNLLKFVKNSPEDRTGGHRLITQEIVNRFTVDVIGATAFGMETHALTDANSIFYQMSKKMSEIKMINIVKSFFYLWFPKLAKFLNLKLFDEAAMRFYIGILTQALKLREATEEGSDTPDDFLQLMIEARKGELKVEDGELDRFETDAKLKPESLGKKSKVVLSDDLTIAQCFLFFTAGFDTVGSVLSMGIYLLAVHQDIQDKLKDEIELVTEASGGEIDYESIGKMETLDMFVSELLRKYPPATRLERKCVKDYRIPDSDVTISKETLVAISVQGMHHDEKYFPDPDKFDIYRFSRENKSKIHPYSYMPFGMGPRNCIAMRFALMETKVAIAHFVKNFVIEPTENTPVPVMLDQQLGLNRPVSKLELKFTPRHPT